MKKEGAVIFSCFVLWKLIFGIAYDGCDDGWRALEQHCYYFGVLEGNATTADDVCKTKDSDLASLWSEKERNFIIEELWRQDVPRESFAWHGLRGNPSNQWEWRDGSKFDLSQLSRVSGTPGNKKDKCGALLGLGNFAFLDCDMDAEAFVCKKALPMVYTTSPLANHSTSGSHFQLFQRVVPPELSVLRPSSVQIAQMEVASETGCAYFCFNIKTCTAFENTCLTSSSCRNYTCKLLENI